MSNGEASFVEAKPNLMLAGMDGIPYVEHTVKLQKGDTLLVYTDGVTEASNADQELFGDERLLAAVQQCQNLSVPDFIKQVRTSISEFVAGAEQFDDITMLAVKIV